MLADENHAGRLIALTGITPDELRARLGERAVLAEVLGFVLGHEPDLIACAAALAVEPQALAEAHQALTGGAGAADWGA